MTEAQTTPLQLSENKNKSCIPAGHWLLQLEMHTWINTEFQTKYKMLFLLSQYIVLDSKHNNFSI